MELSRVTRRRFIACLNQPRKLYNFSSGAVIGAVGGLVIVGLAAGLLFGLASSVLGLVMGNWLSEQLYRGSLQRFIYWHCPYARYWLASNIPDSAARNEL